MKKLKEKQKKDAEAVGGVADPVEGEVAEKPVIEEDKKPAAAKGAKGKGKKINAAAAMAIEKQRLIEEAKQQYILDNAENEK
jgi:hypothetical protein